MKIEVSPAELVKFVTDGQFPESAKETLAGGILAMCNSPEMSKAITAKFETEVHNIMKDSLYVKSGDYYNSKKTLQGWASEILLTDLANKVKELDMKSIISTAVSEEVKKQLDYQMKVTIQQAIATEYSTRLLKSVEQYDMEPVVEAKVKKILASILAK